MGAVMLTAREMEILAGSVRVMISVIDSVPVLLRIATREELEALLEKLDAGPQ